MATSQDRRTGTELMSPPRVQTVPTGLSPDVHERDSRSVELERLRRACVVAVNLLFTTGYKVTDAEYHKLRKSVEEIRALEIERSRPGLPRDLERESSSREWNQRRKSMVTH